MFGARRFATAQASIRFALRSGAARKRWRFAARARLHGSRAIAAATASEILRPATGRTPAQPVARLWKVGRDHSDRSSVADPGISRGPAIMSMPTVPNAAAVATCIPGTICRRARLHRCRAVASANRPSPTDREYPVDPSEVSGHQGQRIASLTAASNRGR
jgi:hypothetical protein